MSEKRVVIFKELNDIHESIKIQKLSNSSYMPDCKGLTESVLNELGLGNGARTIGRLGTVWRCQIGAKAQWVYGRSFADAVLKALRVLKTEVSIEGSH